METREQAKAPAVHPLVGDDLQQMFEQAPVILNAFRGPNHVFVAANAMFRRVTGKSLDVLGQTVREAQPELEGMGFFELLDRVYETGEPVRATEAPARVDRRGTGEMEDGYFNFTYQPIRDASGAVTGVLSVAIDVTETVLARREAERMYAAERRARARAERLHALAVALSGAATVSDAVDAVVREGGAAFGAVGTIVTRVETDGAHLLILGASDLPASVAEEWRRIPLSLRVPLTDVVQNGTALFLESREDWLAQYPDVADTLEATGHHANAVLPLVADGAVLGAIGFAFAEPRRFDDEDRALAAVIALQAALAVARVEALVAARARHEEAVVARREAEVAREAAEAASRAKSQFLATMSHELRTPLNAIAGYTELIELGVRGPVTEQQREDLHRIQQSQRHLLGLINQVLNYARVDAGAVHYNVALVPVREVLGAAELLVSPQARAKRLSVTLDAVDPDLSVRADAEKVRQVLINLLSNAVKFTDPGGHVALSAVRSGDRVAILIADTGIGIPAEQHDRVFEPFVQVRADLTRTAEGVGLGLAISRDLARGMGGDLTVQSDPGRGSTFVLTLPAG